MYVVLGTIKVKSQFLDAFLTHVREHAAASRREKGCLRYDVLQDVDDPQTVCLYEVFRTEADLAFHHAQDYYHRWMAQSRDWRDASAYARRVMRNVSPSDAEWELRS